MGYTSRVFCALALAGLLLGASVLPAQDADVAVKRMVLCKKVENRQPLNETTAFVVADGQGFCYAEISNPGAERTVTWVWTYAEKEYYRLDCRIGTAPAWRIKSAVTLRPGAWKVQLVSAGNVLQEIPFTVTE